MSRIGKIPVAVPSGVKVEISGRTVKVEGPLGKLSLEHRPEVEVKLDGDQIVVTRLEDDRHSRAFHGLTRSLINNMVEGVTKGFEKHLEVYGVGYGVKLEGNRLTINCGKSHPEILPVPQGVTVEIRNPQARGDIDPARFSVKGCDKQVVGEFAAECRQARPPEPYKGKGIRYAGEQVRRKVGKAFVGGEL